MRLLLSITIVATLLHTAMALGGEKPNAILILTDDQRYGDLSCHGNPVLKTSSMDQLLGESIRSG